MMIRRRRLEMTMVIVTMITLMISVPIRCESLMGGHLDNQATTHPDNTESALRYRIANIVPFAFNGGQPFSLEKDPVTGQIDFDKAPPLKALNYTGPYEANNRDDEIYDVDGQQQMDNKESEIEGENNTSNSTNSDKATSDILLSLKGESTDDDQQIPNEINPYSPSFHDFLHLPVHYSNHEKYTSDKYPLISNSYANTKVQGGSNTYNANTINHKNYHHYGGKASTSQSYSMTRKPFVSKIVTTKKPMIMSTTTTTRKPMITTTITTIKTQPPTRRVTTKIPSTTSSPSTTTPTTTTTTTTTTAKPTTTTRKPSTTMPVTIWKPAKVDQYKGDYMEAILPIEKMQNTDGNLDFGDQIFGTSDINGYDDNYEDYALFEYTPNTTPNSTTSTNRAPTTTIATTTTTKKSTTTMTTTTTAAPPITSMPLDPMPINLENNVKVNRPVQGTLNINAAYNDYSNHPINHPNYSPLVIESASNVIVPPDQDTISFVLGNRQNVDGSYYAHGSAIPESPYGEMNPIRPVETGHHNIDMTADHHHHHHHQHHGSTIDNVSPMEQNSGEKWWLNSEQFEKSQNVIEKSKDDKINVVAGYRVVFPTSAPETSTSFEDVSSTIPPTTILPSSSSSSISSIMPMINDGLSQLSEILTPPPIDGDAAIRPSSLPAQRPPLRYSPHHYHQPRPEVPSRIPQPPLIPNGNKYKIRPIHMDLNLPNILPQFRPNVKTSQRRGSDAIGTMIVSNSPKYPPRVSMRPPPPPPPPGQHRPPPQRRPPVSHLQRLNPPPPPPPVHTLRLPTPAALIGTPDNRNSADNVSRQNEIPPLRRNVIGIEGQLDEHNKRLPSINNQILKSRLNDEDSEKITAESLVMPPRAPLFPKRKMGNSSVATLQMIQQHRVQSDIVNNDDDVDNDKDENHDHANRRVDEPPVYVVYPVKGSMGIRPESDDSMEKDPMDESVVIGIHGPQRPLPPETLSQQNNSDDDEKTVAVHTPVRFVSDFPYPPAIPNPSIFIKQLQEKPLLVPNEHQQHHVDNDGFEEKDSLILNQQDKDTSINIIPYLQDHQPFPMKSNIISTTLQLFSNDSPQPSSSLSPSVSAVTSIAYVYTPTTRAPQRRPIESFERNPILLPSQQPSSSSSSAPSPQNFMAPFVASISAEAPSKNGWSVVTGGPFISKPSAASDKIDRNDDINDYDDNISENNTDDRTDILERNKNTSSVNTDNYNKEKIGIDESSGTEKISENFDADNFKPQLFGGFQPIFEFPSDNDQSTSNIKQTDPVTLMEKPRGAKDSGS